MTLTLSLSTLLTVSLSLSLSLSTLLSLSLSMSMSLSLSMFLPTLLTFPSPCLCPCLDPSGRGRGTDGHLRQALAAAKRSVERIWQMASERVQGQGQVQAEEQQHRMWLEAKCEDRSTICCVSYVVLCGGGVTTVSPSFSRETATAAEDI